MIEGLTNALKEIGSEVSSFKEFLPSFTDNNEFNNGSFEESDKPLNKSSLENKDIGSETRELTDEERAEVQEKTGWTDEQMSKCTIDENGVIHYKCDNGHLAGEVHQPSGVEYERKIIDINGIQVEVVVPKFNSKFDCNLPEDMLKESNPRQFKECNRKLKEAIENDPDLRAQFTDEQLEQINNGKTPEGYTWHHDAESGKMQLVDTKEHDRTQGGAAHTGGKALWGGSY